jgi:ATP-dependent DNA helicase RecQ
MVLIESLLGNLVHSEKKELLNSYYGHKDFRPGQEEIIDSILKGRDSVGIMPTGGGKSVCYQIPALMMDGVTIVVSPLVSLMNDQVAALRSMGIKGAYINGSLSFNQLLKAYDRLSMGEYKIVYVAPERLDTDGFRNAISYLKISMVAIDEAHCISQWGNDFRPSYLRIADFIDSLPQRPIVSAFTATATEQVRDDIIRLLKLNDPFIQITGYDRPNLYFDVLKPKNKEISLLRLIKEREGKSGIVYCSTRKAVESVADTLIANGITAARYHAGMEQADRQQNQDLFQYDKVRVMVATNAFGMGIDKSNVNFVIHYNMPKSIEAYYQEAGRAGRDGEPADCIMLFSPGDVKTCEYFIDNPDENDELTPEQRAEVQELDRKRLDAMKSYVYTSDCFRGKFLEYFGEKHQPFCGNCGNCGTEFVTNEITRESQMIMSCAKRINNFLGYSLGESTVVAVLKGSQNSRVLDLRLNEISTYGIAKDISEKYLREICGYLVQEGYLRVNKYKALALTAESVPVLKGKKQLFMKVRKDKQQTKKISAPIERSHSSGNLFEELRKVRNQLSLKEHVPAYIILTDRVLNEICIREPITFGELLEVPGIGKKKAEKYGKYFVDEVKRHKGL